MDKLLGIGDNVVDVFVERGKMYPGGNALNVSVYGKMLGAETGYFGYFGNDRYGTLNRRVLGEVGVDCSRCRIMEGESGYTRVKVENGERVIASANQGGALKRQTWDLGPEDLAYIKDYKVVYSGLNSYIEPRLKQIRESAAVLAYDFSNRFTEQYLQEICPSCDVACISAGHLSREDTCRILHKMADFGTVLAVGTRGKDGTIVYWRGRFYDGKAETASIKDTMGAGDAYLAALLTDLFLRKGHLPKDCLDDAIPEAMAYAAAFAAEICGLEGAFGYGENVGDPKEAHGGKYERLLRRQEQNK